MFFANVAALVPKMEADRAVPDLDSADAAVFQPFAELSILTAVAHPFVEAFRTHDVRPPTGCVVAVPTRPGRREAIEQPRRRSPDSESAQAPAGNTERTEVPEIEKITGGDVPTLDTGARLLVELEVPTGEKVPRSSQRVVLGYEVSPRNTVAIGEDQVVRRARLDRTIQNRTLAEPVVLMPDVLDSQAELGTERIDRRRRLRARAVIRDDDPGRPEPSIRPRRARASSGCCTY